MSDGVDRLINIEELVFANATVSLGGTNRRPRRSVDGQADDTPTEDQPLTVSIAGVTDADNTRRHNHGPGRLRLAGRAAPARRPASSRTSWSPPASATCAPPAPPSRPATTRSGLRLRVKATYQDVNGVIETVFSAPTAPVQNVNDDPTRGPLIDDPTPTEDTFVTALTVTISDPDGTANAVAAGDFTFQWQQSDDGSTWTDIVDNDPNDLSDPTCRTSCQPRTRWAAGCGWS